MAGTPLGISWRGARIVATACFAAQAALSCAPPPATVANLTSEARANELAAYANYRGSRLRVVGRVVSMGLRGARKAAASPRDVPGECDASPFVYLADPTHRTADVALCYFQPDDLEQVASITPNQEVTVSCSFQGFAPLGRGGMQVILHSCTLEDP